MALITLQEVKDEAATPRRQLTITGYSDAILTKEIAKAQAEIERKSGRVFTEKSFTETEINRYSSMIFLKKSPVTEITEFKINDVTVDEDEYHLDSKTGIIEFDNVREFDYSITYKACEDPASDVYLIAQDICMDLVFFNLQKAGDGKDIKSEKDSNYAVTYEDKDPKTKINDRIKEFEKPVIDIIDT